MPDSRKDLQMIGVSLVCLRLQEVLELIDSHIHCQNTPGVILESNPNDGESNGYDLVNLWIVSDMVREKPICLL